MSKKKYAILNVSGFKIMELNGGFWYRTTLDDTLKIRRSNETGAPPTVNKHRWYRTDDEIVAMYIMTKMKVDYYSVKKSKSDKLRLEYYSDFHNRLVEKHINHITKVLSDDTLLVEKFMPTLFDIFIF